MKEVLVDRHYTVGHDIRWNIETVYSLCEIKISSFRHLNLVEHSRCKILLP